MTYAISTYANSDVAYKNFKKYKNWYNGIFKPVPSLPSGELKHN
jgi:hypothetical protein